MLEISYLYRHICWYTTHKHLALAYHVLSLLICLPSSQYRWKLWQPCTSKVPKKKLSTVTGFECTINFVPKMVFYQGEKMTAYRIWTNLLLESQRFHLPKFYYLNPWSLEMIEVLEDLLTMKQVRLLHQLPNSSFGWSIFSISFISVLLKNENIIEPFGKNTLDTK